MEDVNKEVSKKEVIINKLKKIWPLAAKILVVVLIFAALGAGYYFSTKRGMLTPDQAKERVNKVITDNNLVRTGTKVDIKEVKEENGLYKISLSISGQDITSYLTKDGKIFFPEGMPTEPDNKVAGTENQKPAAEIPKSDKPSVDLYVMSFCPYGNKAEDTLKPVYDLLKNKVNFNFHYIVSTNGNDVQSLHGAKEVAQDEREACVLKNYGKDKWMGFVTYINSNCGSDGACWEAGATSLGINKAGVNSCVTSNGLALMQANEKDSNAAGASGSPTMTINGVSSEAVYQYGNSEGYKQAICGAFNTAPAECAKVLSGSTATTQGGSCGN